MENKNSLVELFSLGDLYISDFLQPGETPHAEPVEMKLILESSTGLVKLEKSAPLKSMYANYWYRSGINSTMKMELNDVVDLIEKIVGGKFIGHCPKF